jgi:hypothetical protein
MKLETPTSQNDNEASVVMRKGRNGEVMWSSVKGPPKRGVGEEGVPDHATRETQFFTLRDLIPTEHIV